MKFKNQDGRRSLVYSRTQKQTMPIDSQTPKTYIYQVSREIEKKD